MLDAKLQNVKFELMVDNGHYFIEATLATMFGSVNVLIHDKQDRETIGRLIEDAAKKELAKHLNTVNV